MVFKYIVIDNQSYRKTSARLDITLNISCASKKNSSISGFVSLSRFIGLFVNDLVLIFLVLLPMVIEDLFSYIDLLNNVIMIARCFIFSATKSGS